jgi:SAM-dependent methyltransferase
MANDPRSRRAHWDGVYRSKAPTEVSWFQPAPTVARYLIRTAGISLEAPVIDVGGGASTLVDALLVEGFKDVTVLDVSPVALDHAKARLGDKAEAVHWIIADVTGWRPGRVYGLWHDRAVFHFLTEAEDRRKYVETLKASLAPGGTAILAAFAPDGPERCSGLPVMRHGPDNLAAELGPDFALMDTVEEDHSTPAGRNQRFCYCRFRAEQG